MAKCHTDVRGRGSALARMRMQMTLARVPGSSDPGLCGAMRNKCSTCEQHIFCEVKGTVELCKPVTVCIVYSCVLRQHLHCRWAQYFATILSVWRESPGAHLSLSLSCSVSMLYLILYQVSVVMSA